MRFDQMTPEQHRALASKGGNKPRSKKPMREYCNKGHKLDSTNVELVQRYSYNKDKTKKYIYTTYRCRECMLEAGRKIKRATSRKIREDKRNRPAEIPTHCKRGHAMTDDNMRFYRHKRVDADGRVAIGTDVVCITCKRMEYKIRRYGRADEPDKRSETNKRLWTGKPNSERHKQDAV